ncbi:platelet glycoprotein Ib beta chain [Scleropages formosus]|uniref:Glycoprotein Ib platelet subunit beta n=1 Tax=Scleropages formosus TaxID=113540 RepID=A0A8C9TZQ8_SCLFO|nr:platelet glycoprotein Ib beta chain [Scleropages formosus]
MFSPQGPMTDSAVTRSVSSVHFLFPAACHRGLYQWRPVGTCPRRQSLHATRNAVPKRSPSYDTRLQAHRVSADRFTTSEYLPKMRHTWLCVSQLLCVLLPLLGGESCPARCTCRRGRIDCSGRMLSGDGLPATFPRDATEIQLHDNQLSSLPNGLLDGLPALRTVTLHGNPWVCDCGLLYLRSWLLKQEDRSLYRNITCSSPPGLQGRLVMYLVEEEVLQSCRYWYCNLALASQVSLMVFIVMQAILLLFLILFLRRFEKLSQEARHTAEESLTGRETGSDNEFVPLKERTE